MKLAQNIYLRSIVRHAATFIGGLLVAKGVIDEGPQPEFIDGTTDILMGIIAYAVGQLSSLWEKKSQL